jgi:hypothetical protein
MSRRRSIRQRDRTSIGLFATAELLDAGLIDPLDHNAADHGAWDSGIAKPSQHDGLDTRGCRIEDAVLDVIARKDGPDLFAIGAPPRTVQGDVLATAGLGWNRGKTEQHRREERSNKKRGHNLHHALSRTRLLFPHPICCT